MTSPLGMKEMGTDVYNETKQDFAPHSRDTKYRNQNLKQQLLNLQAMSPNIAKDMPRYSIDIERSLNP